MSIPALADASFPPASRRVKQFTTVGSDTWVVPRGVNYAAFSRVNAAGVKAGSGCVEPIYVQ